MSERSEKTRLIVMIAAGVLCAAGLTVFVVLAPKTGDARLDGLLYSVVPEFFAAAFIIVVVVARSKSILKPIVPTAKTALVCLPCFAVAASNFPFSALACGTGTIERFDLLWLFIIKCVLIGVAEELLFRGMIVPALYSSLKQKRHGAFLTVLVSSAIFAVFHFINLAGGSAFLPVLMQVGYSFLIGAMLAALFLKTGGLYVCVIVHALFDFGGYIISDLGLGNPHDAVFWILTAVIGTICAAHVIYIITVLDKKSYKERLS